MSAAWSFSLSEVRTVSGAFERFLEEQINIGPGIRGIASTSQNHLRDFLFEENRRDPSFPRVLSTADRDFLGGSFARHTKNWPLDDIDVYLPLDGQSLVYLQGGFRLPYTVTSDSQLLYNPLLGSRWMVNGYVSSDQLLGEFVKVLSRHYPAETTVEVDGCAVAVRMTHGASANADGLGYDIIPCFHLQPDDADELFFYLMPDGKNGWMRTNPRVDTYIADEMQKFHNGLYRKVVRLVKHWNHNQFCNMFSSYYIELAISQRFLALQSSGSPIQSISFGVFLAFESLRTAAASGDLTSLIKGSPPVKAPQMDAAYHRYLNWIQSVMDSAVSHETAGRTVDAIASWAIVFGDSFPS